MHDVSIEATRWRLRKVINLGFLNLKVNTIKNAAGRYETAVFESDKEGRMWDIGIKYYSTCWSVEKAIKEHNGIVDVLNSIDFLNLTQSEIWQKIDSVLGHIKYNGPFSYIMPRKNPPNVAIGQKPEDM